MNPELTELVAHSTHPFAALLLNNEPLYLNYVVPEVREANDADFSIVHFITTETVDRFGDIVRADGMNDENFKKNPVVFYGHASWGFPVGKSLWRKPATRNGIKGILAKTQFARTEEGLLCYQLWKEGFLNASSIGFLPVEWDAIVEDDPAAYMGKRVTGYEFKQWELLEYSIVGVPANPDAVRELLQKDCMKSPRFRKALESQLMEMERVRGLLISDAGKDIVEIEGIQFPKHFFRQLGTWLKESLPQHGGFRDKLFEITRQGDGAVNVQPVSESGVVLNHLNKERLGKAKALIEEALASAAETSEEDAASANEGKSFAKIFEMNSSPKELHNDAVKRNTHRVATSKETELLAGAAETLVCEVDLTAHRRLLVKSVIDGKVSELTGRFKKL